MTDRKHNHYFRDVSHLQHVDVYRLLDLFGVTDQALGHAIKKLLCAGQRGAKDFRRDVAEARDTLARRLEMLDEDEVTSSLDLNVETSLGSPPEPLPRCRGVVAPVYRIGEGPADECAGCGCPGGYHISTCKKAGQSEPTAYVQKDSPVGEGWIVWDGGDWPKGLARGVLVDYRLSGATGTYCDNSDAVRWHWLGKVGDVIAYRLTDPSKAG